MVTIAVPRKFVERCQRYLRENPMAGNDVADFIARCGRLGLLYLEKLTTAEERAHCEAPRNTRKPDWLINDGEVIDNRGYRGEKVYLHVPERDFRRIDELVVKKLGITNTVVSWYILCVFNVLAGYWQLPPKV